jgi:hypothetical protein
MHLVGVGVLLKYGGNCVFLSANKLGHTNRTCYSSLTAELHNLHIRWLWFILCQLPTSIRVRQCFPVLKRLYETRKLGAIPEYIGLLWAFVYTLHASLLYARYLTSFANVDRND